MPHGNMRQLISILLISLELLCHAQVADTVRIRQISENADSINNAVLTLSLLDALHKQKKELLAADTSKTTLNPFQLSFADSVRIASHVQLHAATNPMLLPLYLPMLDDDSDSTDIIRNLRRTTIRHIATRNPKLINGTERQLIALAQQMRDTPIKQKGKTLIKVMPQQFEAVHTDLPNALWTKRLRIQLQLTQNYATKNWYKGAANSIALLSDVKGHITYDNNLRISWKNELEWRSGVSTVSGDTLRKVAVTDDMLRIKSTFAYKAIKKLYYSAYVEMQTQLFRTYTGTGSPKLKATFFNPLRINAGIGLEYKPTKNITLNVAPAALKYVFVGDTAKVEPTQYGIAKGKKQLAEFGSTILFNWHYRPIYEIELDTRLFFYTNYHAVEIELEINANFIINQYLSAVVTIYPRFDNTVKPTAGNSHWQFKEYISVGFSHVF